MKENIVRLTKAVNSKIDNLPGIKQYNQYTDSRLAKLQENWQQMSSDRLSNVLLRQDLKTSIFVVGTVDILAGFRRIQDQLIDAMVSHPDSYEPVYLSVFASAALLSVSMLSLMKITELEKERLLKVATSRNLQVTRPIWFRWPFVTKILNNHEATG